jgi:DNA-binding transcriptional ArsR family regulator
MRSSKIGDLFKVFSNQTRVKLIVCLLRPKSVTELLAHCSLSQSALSQHLKILREEGVVVCVHDGKHRVYSVVDKRVSTIAKHLLEMS